MSTIPPNWLGSIVQGHGAQARASEKQTRDALDQAKQAERSSFSDSLHNVVDNDDRDSSVDAEAEGRGGGAGRSHSQPEDEMREDEAKSEETDDRLDIEA